MQAPSFFTQHKMLITEIAVAVALLVIGYYGVSLLTNTETTSTTEGAINQQLLGQNFVIFLQAVNQDKVNISNTTFLDSQLVRNMQDFSEVIGETSARGRADPFLPYASSRPIR
jgi:hypothetical protein